MDTVKDRIMADMAKDYVKLKQARLRDEFAMAALTGLMAFAHTRIDESYDNLALWSYQQADAMLKAREVKHE